MKILVGIKRVIDAYVKIRVNSDNSGVYDDNTIKHSMNPFCEIALEEAIRIKEKHPDSEIIIVTIGDENCTDVLRHGLALGADKALLIKTPDKFSSLNIAKILAHVVKDINPDLVLLGKQSIDGDNNQTPQMLASLLNYPQATFASSITIEADKALVTRELDTGLQTIDITLPAIISVDLRLNEPRYATLPNIMKSKQKPLDIIDLPLELNLKENIRILKVTEPEKKQAGIKVETVDELLDKLFNEAKVF